MATNDPSPATPAGTSRRLLLVGAVLVVAGLVAALWFLFLRDDSITEAEATYDGSELTVAIEDGTSITIPAGAATPGARVRVAILDSDSLPELPSYSAGVIGAWAIDVENGLIEPVTLRFPAPNPEATWVLARYSDGRWENVGFELVDGQLVAEVETLSQFHIHVIETLVDVYGKFDAFLGNLPSNLADAVVNAPDEFKRVLLENSGKLLERAVAAGTDILKTYAEVLAWMYDKYRDLFVAIKSIGSPDACLEIDIDRNVRVTESEGNTLIAGCATYETENQNTSKLVISSKRLFFLDVLSVDGAKLESTRIPFSCCDGGTALASGLTLSWSTEFNRTRDVRITSRMSPESSYLTLMYLMLSLLPGVDVVVDPTVANSLITIVRNMPFFQQLREALDSGHFSAAMDAITRVLFTGEVIAEFTSQFIDEILMHKRLVARLGVNVSESVLKNVLIVLKVADVLGVISDVGLEVYAATKVTGELSWPQSSITFSNLRPRAVSPPDSPLSEVEIIAPPDLLQNPDLWTSSPSVTDILSPDRIAALAAVPSEGTSGSAEETPPSPDAAPTPAATLPTTAAVTATGTPPTTATVTPAATPPTTATVTPAATPPTTATVTPAATPPTTATVTPAATPPTTATVTPAATPTPPVTLTPAPASTPSAGLILASVSAGREHSCGVKPDGSVICWGRNQWGQTEPPDGTFTSVSAGGGHTCGVRTDGSVACWGSAGEAKATPPSGSFQSVSAGPEHTCGIRTDGSVVCWGSGEVFNPAESPPGSFTSVGAGQYHTCGVRDDGTLTCWGYTRLSGDPPKGTFTSISVYGRDQCAVRIDSSLACWGTEGTGLTSPPAGSFESVSAGPNRACGITTDGAAVCWGEGTSDPLLKPDGSFASIALGQDHYCGLRPDGAVACWGSNGEDRSLPPESLFVTVHPAEGYFCGLRADGSVTCRDSEARTTGSWGLQFSPSVPFLDVSSASLWGCGVRTSGELTCWGEPIRLDSLDRVGARPTGSFLEVSISNNHGCALKADGSIACWGGDAEGETDAPPGSFVSVHVGTEYSCGLRADGAAACWGNGIEADAATIDGTFTSIDVGRFRGCGLRTNGDIECWHGGSLAPGRESDPTNPFVSVTVGSWLACGLRSDGTPDCWAIDDHQTPLAVPGGQFTFIEATSAGGSSAHVCGVRPDGSVTCWLAAP